MSFRDHEVHVEKKIVRCFLDSVSKKKFVYQGYLAGKDGGCEIIALSNNIDNTVLQDG